MPQRGRLVALEGPSGVGKSRVAAAATRRFGWAVLAEAYDRLDRTPSLRFADDEALLSLETVLLEEDARRFRDAEHLVAEGATVLADTGFVGTVSYTAALAATGQCRPATWRRLLGRAEALARRSLLGLPDITVCLVAPEELRAEREARDPRRHPAEFRARHREAGLYEAEVFWPWLASRLPRRVAVVRSVGPPEQVAGRLDRLLRRGSRARAPAALLDRALVALARAGLPTRPGSEGGAPPPLRRTGATVKNGTPSARPPSA